MFKTRTEKYNNIKNIKFMKFNIFTNTKKRNKEQKYRKNMWNNIYEMWDEGLQQQLKI